MITNNMLEDGLVRGPPGTGGLRPQTTAYPGGLGQRSAQTCMYIYIYIYIYIYTYTYMYICAIFTYYIQIVRERERERENYYCCQGTTLRLATRLAGSGLEVVCSARRRECAHTRHN